MVDLTIASSPMNVFNRIDRIVDPKKMVKPYVAAAPTKEDAA
jgi:hypothetical protein